MKKMIYKGEKQIRLLVPFDKVVNPGDEIEVTNAAAKSLELVGFEAKQEKKEKEGDK